MTKINYKTDKPGVFLQMHVYYNLGGMNFFTSSTMTRGYYISVTPVEIRDGFQCTKAFSGYCTCILPVRRQSRKSEEQAEQLAIGRVRDLLIAVAAKNNLIAMELPDLGKPDA